MITTGHKNDGSWSQSGYEGLRLIEKEFNAKVDFSGPVADAESEAPLRKYAKEGYDLVIGHSGGYIKSAEKVANEFPRTKFALVTTYSGNNRNLGAVAFRSGEAGYLSGVLAAMKTKTNKVAYIVGYDYPVYKEEAALFRKGAKATNPNVEIVTEFLQTWTDGEKGKKVALALADKGYDCFAINADEAGVGALKAVTQRDGIHVIGWTTDQHGLAPDRVITSVLQDIPKLVLNAADLMQRGQWEGKLYKFGLKEGIYNFAPFRGSLTPEQEAKFMTIKNKVMAGEIDISAPQT
jgi:basic membrane lipoprotein Med (substrate-binding protein (PBP1-ABC) superfamily)